MTMGASGIRLLAQRQSVDERTLDEMAADESRALGVRLDLRWVDDLGVLRRAVDDASDAGEPLVVLPAPGSADLTDVPADAHPQVVRLDLGVREPDRSPGLVTHIQGRGAWGLVWALRAAHHRRRRVVHTIRYGEGPEQFGELRLPAGRDGAAHPVVTLLHGGFWRSCWQLDLMDALGIDLADRGVATWNLEYRRPDRHGWAATVADVSRGLAHLDELRRRWPLDLGRAAVVGHSAGGSLAVQAAADGVGRNPKPVRLVVQLAGLVDLVGTDQRGIGNGAVALALGGTPEQLPGVYTRASPLERLPSGVPQLVVIGRSDSVDLLEMSRRYVRTARVQGDDVTLLEGDGDHFSVINPASGIWEQTATALTDALLA